MGKTNDPRHLAEKARDEREAAHLADEDFVCLSGTPEGQRFLWRLMGRCGVFSSIWHASAQIHFNEGQRNVGLMILTDINRLCPQVYMDMVTRNAEVLKKHKRNKDKIEGESADSSAS